MGRDSPFSLRILLWLLMLAGGGDKEGNAVPFPSFRPASRHRLMTDNFLHRQPSSIPFSGVIGYQGASGPSFHSNKDLNPMGSSAGSNYPSRFHSMTIYPGYTPGHPVRPVSQEIGYSLYGRSNPPKQSPFASLFGSDIENSVGIYDSFGQQRSRRVNPFDDVRGPTGKSDFGSQRRHPFSSLRLTPITKVSGVSVDNPDGMSNYKNYDDNDDDDDDEGDQLRRGGLGGVFGRGNRAHSYRHDDPFEKPISRSAFPLPRVNDPITLDLAQDEIRRVKYAKQTNELPPPRSFVVHKPQHKQRDDDTDRPGTPGTKTATSDGGLDPLATGFNFVSRNGNRLALPSIPALPSERKKKRNEGDEFGKIDHDDEKDSGSIVSSNNDLGPNVYRSDGESESLSEESDLNFDVQRDMASDDPLNEPEDPPNEPEYPLNEPDYPLNEPENPLNEPEDPPNEPEYPLNEPEYPLNEPEYPLNEPEYPLNEPEYPLNEPDYPLNEPDYPLNEPEYPMNEPEYPLNEPEYPLNELEDPLNAPEDPLNAPEDPLNAPEDPLNAPEDPLNAPEDPLNAPEDPLNAPEDPLNAPEEPLNEDDERGLGTKSQLADGRAVAVPPGLHEYAPISYDAPETNQEEKRNFVDDGSPFFYTYDDDDKQNEGVFYYDEPIDPSRNSLLETDENDSNLLQPPPKDYAMPPEEDGTSKQQTPGKYDKTTLTQENIMKQSGLVPKNTETTGSRVSSSDASGVIPATKRVTEETIESGKRTVVNNQTYLPTDHVGFILTDQFYDDDDNKVTTPNSLIKNSAEVSENRNFDKFPEDDSNGDDLFENVSVDENSNNFIPPPVIAKDEQSRPEDTQDPLFQSQESESHPLFQSQESESHPLFQSQESESHPLFQTQESESRHMERPPVGSNYFSQTPGTNSGPFQPSRDRGLATPTGSLNPNQVDGFQSHPLSETLTGIGNNLQDQINTKHEHGDFATQASKTKGIAEEFSSRAQETPDGNEILADNGDSHPFGPHKIGERKFENNSDDQRPGHTMPMPAPGELISEKYRPPVGNNEMDWETRQLPPNYGTLRESQRDENNPSLSIGIMQSGDTPMSDKRRLDVSDDVKEINPREQFAPIVDGDEDSNSYVRETNERETVTLDNMNQYLDDENDADDVNTADPDQLRGDENGIPDFSDYNSDMFGPKGDDFSPVKFDYKDNSGTDFAINTDPTSLNFNLLNAGEGSLSVRKKSNTFDPSHKDVNIMKSSKTSSKNVEDKSGFPKLNSPDYNPSQPKAVDPLTPADSESLDGSLSPGYSQPGAVDQSLSFGKESGQGIENDGVTDDDTVDDASDDEYAGLFPPASSYQEIELPKPAPNAFSSTSSSSAFDSPSTTTTTNNDDDNGFPSASHLSSPFQSMFGKSVDQAEKDSFGSLFQNRQPKHTADRDARNQFPHQDRRGMQRSRSRPNGGRGGLSVQDGGGGLFSGATLFDERLGQIVQSRPSLDLFGREWK